jgi:peptidoglycan/xylan/chitin deacetylase (PgdA/CDA1 family)
VLPPVLCYHKVERRRELGVTRLSPRRFAAQIGALNRAGWKAISLGDFAATVRGERESGDRELLITFDDAYRGLRDHAFPILRDAGFAAACFVITDFAGRLNRWDVAYGGRRFAHLAWRDIEAWSGRGIEFASHTATHPRLTWVDDRRVEDELVRSRFALQSALGASPGAIAYPFGALDARVTAAAASAGYSLGFSVGGQWQGDALAVPRTPVHCWSPLLPGVGRLASIERAISSIAGRCSIGTTILRSLTPRSAYDELSASSPKRPEGTAMTLMTPKLPDPALDRRWLSPEP